MKRKIITTTAFVAALVLLLMISGRAAAASEKPQGADNAQATVEGIVVPDNIYAGQPFTFAAPRGAEKQVNVQTIDGEVVQHSFADKYGRVFVSAGLPAGAYLITAANGRHGRFQPVGKVEIPERPAGALLQPAQFSPDPIQLKDAPLSLKTGDSLTFKGRGFNPDAGKNLVSLAGAGDTESLPVLAATEGQLKLAPAARLTPGVAELQVTNLGAGHSTRTQKLLVYDIRGTLERRKLTSGNDQTQLVLTTQPADIPMRVKVTVVSGPVDFGSEGKSTDAVTVQGRAVFPVHSENVAGPFRLAWALAPLTRIDDCKCDLKTARCDIPDPGNTCWEWQNAAGQWSCGSH